jgi:[ribosomal protein S5]-alanine N-acetyltransferase
MQVRLEKPASRHEARFLAAVRRSRALHKGLISAPNTPDRYRQYVRDLRRVNRNGFLIVTAEGDDIVGVINISEIVRGLFQSAYLGYYALMPYAGKGLMRQGFAQALDHFFDVDKLHRLEANIQPTNQRSISLVRNLGFRLEGYSPRYLKISGRWRDHERWAILAEEWRGRSIRNDGRSIRRKNEI